MFDLVQPLRDLWHKRAKYDRKCYQVGRVFPMVVFILLHAEFGPNDHREDASHFNPNPTVNLNCLCL